jgi:hypothetical protein
MAPWRAVLPCTGNLQVKPGIFAGTTQVRGLQTVYGYGHRCDAPGARERRTPQP